MNVLERVEIIRSQLHAIAHQFASPSAALFHENREAIELLEKSLNLKTDIDSSFTFSAMAAGAGSVVGSSKTIDYLTKQLGLTRAEAQFRIDRALSLYRVGDDVAAACREATSPVSADCARIIHRELARLDKSLRHEIPDHYAAALALAQNVAPDELRRTLRARIDARNNSLDPDPARARRKRSFNMGTQDRDGGVSFSGYAPAGDAALLEAAIANGVKSGCPEVEGEKAELDDVRTFTQRRYDALMGILRKHESLRAESSNSGLGTVVVSITQDDIDSMTAESEFRTNTSYKLSPYELLTLGLSERGMTIFHGPHGDPVTATVNSRHAGLLQRIVLAVTDGVCTHPGCDQAAVWCDVHHLVAWARGGGTSLDNLTLLCRHHHTSNDDSRQRPDRGHAFRCPDTKRAGYRIPGRPPQFNDSYPANQYPGARIRAAQKS